MARALLTGFFVAAALAFGGHHLVIDAQSLARNLPEFEVDKAWPKVPPTWKLGDASSFAIDDKDNVWLLHRPRTVKAGEAPAHNLVRRAKTVRGAARMQGRSGPNVSTASTSMRKASCGSRATTARPTASPG